MYKERAAIEQQYVASLQKLQSKRGLSGGVGARGELGGLGNVWEMVWGEVAEVSSNRSETRGGGDQSGRSCSRSSRRGERKSSRTSREPRVDHQSLCALSRAGWETGDSVREREDRREGRKVGRSSDLRVAIFILSDIYTSERSREPLMISTRATLLSGNSSAETADGLRLRPGSSNARADLLLPSSLSLLDCLCSFEPREEDAR